MDNLIFIVSGQQGSGKTTYLYGIMDVLKGRGGVSCGIIAHGFWENGKRSGFEIEVLRTGQRITLCKTGYVDGWEKFRRFYFNPGAWKAGEKALHPDQVEYCDIIIIDEIGPLELERKGWFNAVSLLLKNTDKSMVWTVREELVDKVISFFNITNYKIIKV